MYYNLAVLLSINEWNFFDFPSNSCSHVDFVKTFFFFTFFGLFLFLCYAFKNMLMVKSCVDICRQQGSSGEGYSDSVTSGPGRLQGGGGSYHGEGERGGVVKFNFIPPVFSSYCNITVWAVWHNIYKKFRTTRWARFARQLCCGNADFETAIYIILQCVYIHTSVHLYNIILKCWMESQIVAKRGHNGWFLG